MNHLRLFSILISLAMFGGTSTTWSKDTSHNPSPTHAAPVSQHGEAKNGEAKNADAKKVDAHAKSATAHSTGHGHVAGVDADTALGWLKNGNARFLKKTYRKDGKSAEDRKRLATGQKPHTIVVSCSDSRVPPELVFDQSLGEVFVVRVAGEALDSSVVASVEYAAEHLGSKLVLVLGHTSCGAVKASMETPVGKSAGSADLDKLVEDIRPRLPKSEKASPGLKTEVTANAKGVAEDLVKRSKILKQLSSEGGLKVKAAVYNLDSGVVDFH